MISVSVLLAMNRLFPPPVHPFNTMSAGGKSYARWQYDNGAATVQFFTARYSERELFFGKKVLDVGCGAAGKSLYYASKGAEVTGLEIFPEYEAQANEFAASVNLKDRFTFVLGDAARMPFADNTFDTIIANDAFEHIATPQLALSECIRVLKKGGKLCINFPPYYHPSGAHLTDVIYIPWVHILFRDKTLIAAYKKLVAHMPDADTRLRLRISKDESGGEYFGYINKMTILKFKTLLRESNAAPEYYHEAPLRRYFAPFAKIPIIREMFIKMVVCVITK